MFLYPYGDFHSLNLGWFLLQFKDWIEKIQEYLDNGGGTSENLANVIAPVFNAANTYSAGDYVLYNNELKKANQAVNPGTWNPDAWDNVLIVDEMGSGGAGIDNVARLMIAGQYSATFAYQKYGICRYNDKLWMCNTDLPTGGEAWNAAHWDEITVGAGLSGLRISVDTLNASIVNIQNSLNTSNDFKGKKILIIGDSWSTGWTGAAVVDGWIPKALEILGCTCDSIKQYGAGFATAGLEPYAQYVGETFVQVLEHVKNNDYYAVVVQGATNDILFSSTNEITRAIATFTANCKEYFPNAKIFYFPTMPDWYVNIATRTGIVNALISESLKNGMTTFTEALDWAWDTPGLIGADQHHLTQNAYSLIGAYIATDMLGAKAEKSILQKTITNYTRAASGVTFDSVAVTHWRGLVNVVVIGMITSESTGDISILTGLPPASSIKYVPLYYSGDVMDFGGRAMAKIRTGGELEIQANGVSLQNQNFTIVMQYQTVANGR